MAMEKSPQPIKIAILAMGGEGGGVLIVTTALLLTPPQVRA